jgi:pSer/pThr/pTyr-binding forkhead associated (FHA) protein
MASLIVTSGKQKGSYYPLGRRTSVIGRDEALLIQILDNLVSRKHLQIRFDEKTNRYYAFDMKSRNGVYVNNQRIAKDTVLSDGDVILIGTTTLLFTEEDFDSQESAMLYYKKVGERMRVTVYEGHDSEQPQADPDHKAEPVDCKQRQRET